MKPASKLLQRGCFSVHLQQEAIFHRSVTAFLLLILCADSAVPGATAAKTTTFTKLFVIGDSYVDIGNRDPKNFTRTAVGNVNQAWLAPYGQSHPEGPSGRFSDGKVLSDYLASYMGLNPRPFIEYEARPSTTTEDGVNFAVGGAGVFNNLGFTKTRDQIAQLRALLNTGVYSSSVFNESLILFTISGNDYSAFLRDSGGVGLAGVGVFIVAVVNQIVQDLKSLYNLGFRDFAVSYLPPLGCLPSVTSLTLFLACVDAINVVSATHNTLLTTRLHPSTNSLPGANLIFLNTQAAFTAVVTNPLQTEFPAPLKPCCFGTGLGNLCGDVNSAGVALYTVCSPASTPRFFFWDEVHPTEAGWAYIFILYQQGLYTNDCNTDCNRLQVVVSRRVAKNMAQLLTASSKQAACFVTEDFPFFSGIVKPTFDEH